MVKIADTSKSKRLFKWFACFFNPLQLGYNLIMFLYYCIYLPDLRRYEGDKKFSPTFQSMTWAFLGLIVLCCVASWLFYLIYKVLEGISHLIKNDCEGKNCRQYVEYAYFCLLCGFANSSINPFLYYIRNKEIRQRMQSLLNRRFFFLAK